MKFKLNPFAKKQQSGSVKFWVNNIIADWGGFQWSTDKSNLGIIETAEDLPDLFMVIDYISSIIANIPVKVEKKSGRESNNSELLRLISDPNYYQNWKELIKQFTAYYELLGNTYLYAIVPDGMKTISSLHVLPAGQMGVVLLLDKRLPDWMNQIAAYKMTLAGQEYDILPDFVLHKRNFNFRYNDGSYIYGISKYVPGNKITTELKAIYDAKTSIISQRGALGILSNQSEIPDPDESKLIKEKLKEKFGLGMDQDKFIITTQNISWQQMSMGIDELQIIENAKYSFAKICQLNGIDPVIFSTEGSTFANKEQAQKNFMKNVIKPKVDDIYSDFNQWIAPYFGGDRIVPDWSQVEEMQADLKTLTDIYTRQIESGIVTPYQAAMNIFGKVDETNPPKDEYFRKTSLVPIEQPEQTQTTPINENETELERLREMVNENTNENGS